MLFAAPWFFQGNTSYQVPLWQRGLGMATLFFLKDQHYRLSALSSLRSHKIKINQFCGLQSMCVSYEAIYSICITILITKTAADTKKKKKKTVFDFKENQGKNTDSHQWKPKLFHIFLFFLIISCFVVHGRKKG